VLRYITASAKHVAQQLIVLLENQQWMPVIA